MLKESLNTHNYSQLRRAQLVQAHSTDKQGKIAQVLLLSNLIYSLTAIKHIYKIVTTQTHPKLVKYIQKSTTTDS